MTIKNILKNKNMSVYRLAKESRVPYATSNDIVNGRSKLEKCSAETVYMLSRVLNISMEELLAPCFFSRCSFENFKSLICHRVKEKGDIDFIIDILESDEIRMYYNREWYPESLYLLGMLDYLSIQNEVPLCDEYDDLRKYKLDKQIYPESIIALAESTKNNDILRQAEANAIPEFKRFNIIENEVRNVV